MQKENKYKNENTVGTKVLLISLEISANRPATGHYKKKYRHRV